MGQDLAPSDDQTVNARRTSDSHPWDFYWAVDRHRRCLLILRSNAVHSRRLPKLRGLDVSVRDDSSDPRPYLMVRLLDAQLQDVFAQLCEDIISHASDSLTEAEAYETSVRRLWKWHHLLRGGALGLLSPNEQRGLIGELLAMETYLVDLHPTELLNSWGGPLHAPQDFVIGHVGIECKTNAGPTSGRVRISSEHQLSLASLERLFLHTCVLDPTDGNTAESFTLSEVASRLRNRLLAAGEPTVERFESLLMAAGFDFNDDYSEYRWRGGERSIHEIDKRFPRLTPEQLPQGVSDVKYSIALESCESYLSTPAKLRRAIESQHVE